MDFSKTAFGSKGFLFRPCPHSPPEKQKIVSELCCRAPVKKTIKGADTILIRVMTQTSLGGTMPLCERRLREDVVPRRNLALKASRKRAAAPRENHPNFERKIIGFLNHHKVFSVVVLRSLRLPTASFFAYSQPIRRSPNRGRPHIYLEGTYTHD